MKFFSRGCGSREAAYLVSAGRLGARERIALETHAISCAECADALRNSPYVDAALRGAFAPLRERRTIIAPGRVRLAVGPRSAPTNKWLRAPQFFGRLAEVTVMLGVALLVVGGSLEQQSTSITPTHAVVQESFHAQPPTNEIDYFRWFRLTKQDVSPTVSAIRLPMGGRFDYDPVEFAKGPGASPR